MSKFKDAVTKELLREKVDKKGVDKLYIQTLQKFLDKDEIDFESFQNTGRISPYEMYQHLNLHLDCYNLFTYVFDRMIQHLKDGQYYIEEGKLFDTLEQAERELFNKITKELHED
jgi:hypothetical protein